MSEDLNEAVSPFFDEVIKAWMDGVRAALTSKTTMGASTRCTPYSRACTLQSRCYAAAFRWARENLAPK